MRFSQRFELSAGSAESSRNFSALRLRGTGYFALRCLNQQIHFSVQAIPFDFSLNVLRQDVNDPILI